MDLVDEMQWEDVIPDECIVSLEEAGLEESSEQPLFGLMGAESTRHSIYSYVEWFYDGDSSAFSIL
jgi:hypothetical protein